MIDLIENATIVYKNGNKRIFEVISITEKGVYTGFIKSSEDKDVFVNNSFIPVNQIRKITILGSNGKIMKINF
jgi:hypothetical protein